MQNWCYFWLIVVVTRLLTACGPSQIAERSTVTPQATRSDMMDISAASNITACRVTQPSAQPFTPPPPYSPNAPYESEFWYGTEALWTLLSADGIWQQLPQNDGVYTQKTFWWKKGYDWRAEPAPSLTVTGKRLDGLAPPLEASTATNGYHDDLKSFMLVGVDLPTAGCWEITGHSEGHDLSFVVWVEP